MMRPHCAKRRMRVRDPREGIVPITAPPVPTLPLRVEADYLVETIGDPRRAVEIMAGEQSSGTFVPVPGETPELKARSAARVERLEVLGERVETPTLPTTAVTAGAEICRARATLSWPLDNLGPSLPNLLATVAGNLFE